MQTGSTTAGSWDRRQGIEHRCVSEIKINEDSTFELQYALAL
jgi:hypothetical protein